MYIWLEWEKELKTTEFEYTQEPTVWIFCELLLLHVLLLQNWQKTISRHRITLVSSHFSSFASLAQGHLKASNHLSFSSPLYFCESGTGPSISRYQIILVSPRFSTFVSLIYLRLFSTAQPWVVWCNAKAHSNVTSYSCLPLVFLISAGYIIFQMPTQILVVISHPSYHLHVAHRHATFYVAFLLRDTCSLFTVENWSVSCLFLFLCLTSFQHVTHPIYMACQKGSSS